VQLSLESFLISGCCQKKILKMSRVCFCSNSGCNLSPFCHGGSSVVLEVLAAVEMALQIEMIVD
jgi:hypothetical protein